MDKQCEACKGACCKVLFILKKRGMDKDFLRFLLYHGAAVEMEHYVLITNRCKYLDLAGKCKIYADRPDYCKNFRINGELCHICRGAALRGLIH